VLLFFWWPDYVNGYLFPSSHLAGANLLLVFNQLLY